MRLSILKKKITENIIYQKVRTLFDNILMSSKYKYNKNLIKS